jgi:hypothetical protein
VGRRLGHRVAGVNAVKVTFSHAYQGEETVDIQDNYVLVCAGTCTRHGVGVVVHYLGDGTETHVITVKGIKR